MPQGVGVPEESESVALFLQVEVKSTIQAYCWAILSRFRISQEEEMGEALF